MLPSRLGLPPSLQENPLSISWHDSAWIPVLNTSNVMDYFSERSNPFFDRTCNNEIVKMQRLNPEQLQLVSFIYIGGTFIINALASRILLNTFYNNISLITE